LLFIVHARHTTPRATAIMVIKNRKSNAHADDVEAVLEEEAKKID